MNENIIQKRKVMEHPDEKEWENYQDRCRTSHREPLND